MDNNILSALDKEQLAKCKRIYNQALVFYRDFHVFLKGTEANLSDEDRRKIAAAIAAEEKPISYLKKDGKIDISFLHESYSKKTRSKKNKAYEDPQVASDNLVDNLKNEKRIIEDLLAGQRPSEKDQDIIKNIITEEATNSSITEDFLPIFKGYLISLNQKIELLNKSSIDADHRKLIHKTLTKKREEKRLDEFTLAISLALSGKVPTLEEVAQRVLESENDTSKKELLKLNQYEGNVEELIEVFVISQSEPVIDEHTDKIQMMLVPIDADIGECVAVQGYKPYLHPTFEECHNKYALTAFSPINDLPVDIGPDKNGVLSTDGFNGYSSTNPNNNLLLKRAKSNVVEAKLLSAEPDVKLLPAASSDDSNDLDDSSAIVLVDKSESSALDVIPESISTLDIIYNEEEALEIALRDPESTLRTISIENSLEQRNNGGFIVKSNGEEAFQPSCKNLATKVVRNTQKIQPLFPGQLVEGDSSYFNYVNNVTRVFIRDTGETVTYKGLVKLRKFASDEAIAVDDAKVLKVTIENASNIAEATEYDGPSLQSLKNDYQLTVADAQDIIRTYWNIEQNNETRANNTVLSDKEYYTYRESKKYDPQSNVMRESDLLSVSESSVKSLKNFLKYVDDNENAKAFAIKELDALLSGISEEQAKILNTPPKEIPNLVLAMTYKSNEVKDIKIEITDIVTNILQKHFQCDIDKARKMLALYPAVETVLDIGTKEDELGNETFHLPSDIWTNEDYRYEEWNGQRNLLPFPTKQEYKKFVGFIKNIKGDDLKWDSFLLTIDLKMTLNLLNSQDLDAARELKTQIDNKAQAQAQRKIEQSEEVVIEELSSSTEELLDIDIQISNDIQNDSEAELEDLGFVDPSINISSKDLLILEEILQSKLSDKRLPLKHKMVWRKFFGSVAYEEVTTEAINEKLTKARKLLHRS